MICLTMIVRNEAHVVLRALDSIADKVDCWYVQDTGSTDGTQEVISIRLAHLPGAIESAEWVDFATNRTSTMRRAEAVHGLGSLDYHLILDADDALELLDGSWPALGEADAYMLRVRQKGTEFWRSHIFRADGEWSWLCPVHEFAYRESAIVSCLRTPVYISHGGGGRSQDPQKYARDAEMLERALRENTPKSLVPRLTFYLAQSHRDAGQAAKAIDAYTARYSMTEGYAQERYVSCLELASLCPLSRVTWYRRAFHIDAFRVEAPFWLGKHYSEVPLAEGEAFLWATYAASLPPREDALFYQVETHTWAKNLKDYLYAQLTVSRW